MRLILNAFGRLLDVSLDRLTDDDVEEPQPDVVGVPGHLEPVRGTSVKLGFTSPANDWDYPDDSAQQAAPIATRNYHGRN